MKAKHLLFSAQYNDALNTNYISSFLSLDDIKAG